MKSFIKLHSCSGDGLSVRIAIPKNMLVILGLFCGSMSSGARAATSGYVGASYQRLSQKLDGLGSRSNSTQTVGQATLRYGILQVDSWYLGSEPLRPDHWTARLAPQMTPSNDKDATVIGPVLSYSHSDGYSGIQGVSPAARFLGLGFLAGTSLTTSLYALVEWKFWFRPFEQSDKIDGRNYRVRTSNFHTLEGGLTWRLGLFDLRLKLGQVGPRSAAYPSEMLDLKMTVPTIRYAQLTPAWNLTDSFKITGSIFRSSAQVSAEEAFYAVGYRYLEYAQNYTSLGIEWVFGS